MNHPFMQIAQKSKVRGHEGMFPGPPAEPARPGLHVVEAPPAQARVPAPFHRHHIETAPAPDIAPHPSRFRVKVKRGKLIAMVLRELLGTRGNLEVALSRPCVYGVFSRRVGGLAPIHASCVGCLRCTTQYPEMVQVLPNPRRRLGDSYITPDHVDTILYEARGGRVPVRGAGYRGAFGGDGWDAMWTDMSEIVRPTRDGIHGREFISSSVEIGPKPDFLSFDERGVLVGPLPRTFSIELPFVFELPPAGRREQDVLRTLSAAAAQTGTLLIAPLGAILGASLAGGHLVPVVGAGELANLARLAAPSRLVLLDGCDPGAFDELRERVPEAIAGVRVPFEADILRMVRSGVRVLFLTADLHGRTGTGFVMEAIQRVHRELVAARLREQVTLLGGGGVVLAEHVPKAIISGLDVVAVDIALAIALQARLDGECAGRTSSALRFPRFPQAWGVARLANLAASWRDQLLEIMGAMGLREVRRLRGELGRCMLCSELEREAFGGIDGYEG